MSDTPYKDSDAPDKDKRINALIDQLERARSLFNATKIATERTARQHEMRRLARRLAALLEPERIGRV
jgi:hypothetical protein